MSASPPTTDEPGTTTTVATSTTVAATTTSSTSTTVAVAPPQTTLTLSPASPRRDGSVTATLTGCTPGLRMLVQYGPVFDAGYRPDLPILGDDYQLADMTCDDAGTASITLPVARDADAIGGYVEVRDPETVLSSGELRLGLATYVFAPGEAPVVPAQTGPAPPLPATGPGSTGSLAVVASLVVGAGVVMLVAVARSRRPMRT